MIRYQIKDWSKHFENDRSRTRKHCNFVCVPNKQHGMGFSRIMAEKDGAMIYGIWHMILGACSQQSNRDGWLTADGEQTGSAWGVDDLSLKFRRPEAEIKRAIEFLASEKVGWIIIHNTSDLPVDNVQLTDHSPTTHRQVTSDSPTSHLEGKGREEKEGKEDDTLTPPDEKQTKPEKCKATFEEVKSFCRGVGIGAADAEWFFFKCEANGWTNSGRPIKDWKSTLRAWKAGNYLPSQKNAGRRDAFTPTRPTRQDTNPDIL